MRDHGDIEAREAIRALIGEVVLTPDNDELRIDLRGNLDGMLGVVGAPTAPVRQMALVAGARNHLNLEFAWAAA